MCLVKSVKRNAIHLDSSLSENVLIFTLVCVNFLPISTMTSYTSKKPHWILFISPWIHFNYIHNYDIHFIKKKQGVPIFTDIRIYLYYHQNTLF